MKLAAELPFTALVWIDWSDRKHDFCLQGAGRSWARLSEAMLGRARPQEWLRRVRRVGGRTRQHNSRPPPSKSRLRLRRLAPPASRVIVKTGVIKIGESGNGYFINNNNIDPKTNPAYRDKACRSTDVLV